MSRLFWRKYWCFLGYLWKTAYLLVVFDFICGIIKERVYERSIAHRI